MPLPVALSAQFDGDWSSEAGNEIFVFQTWNGSRVLHRLGFTENDFRYRILWKTSSAPAELYLIAQSNDKEDIVRGWVWLNENIVQTISEDIDNQAKDTAIMARLSDVLPSDQQAIMAIDVQFKLSNSIGLMEGEDLVLHSKANLQGSTSRGILALTSIRLVFIAGDDTSAVMSVGEIEEVKVTGNFLFGPALVVNNRDGTKSFSFSKISPLSPYSFQSKIEEIRGSAMRAIISGTNSPIKSQPIFRTAAPDSKYNAPDRTQIQFRAFPADVLIGCYPCAKVSLQSNPKQLKSARLSFANCQIHLYTNWLCVKASSPQNFSLSVPLKSIAAIHKSSSAMLQKTVIDAVCKVDCASIKLYGIAKGNEFFAAASHQLIEGCSSKIPKFDADFIHVDAKEDPPSYTRPLNKLILKNIKSTLPIQTRVSDQLDVAWTDYLEVALVGPHIMAKTEDMRQLLWRYGLTERHRTIVWPLLANIACTDAVLEYKEALDRAHDTIPLSVVEEIDKDLNRSLPEHPFFKEAQALDALKRVLMVTSWHNNVHGYTQAMNMIAAILLIYLAEPVAAQVLNAITLYWLPDTYSRSMLGGAVDQRVFEETINNLFPNIQIGDVALISFGWFVALFANMLPFDKECRFFDVFLAEGPVAIYWFGMSVFSEALAGKSDIDDGEAIFLSVNQVFQKIKSDRKYFESVLWKAFETFSPKFPLDAMVEAKQRHTSQALRHLSDRTRTRDLKRLVKQTDGLTLEEAGLIYDVVVGSSLKDPQNTLQTIDLTGFKILARQLCPWTISSGPSIVSPLFAYMAQGKNYVSIDQIADIICKTTKATPKEQAALFFDVKKPAADSKDAFIANNSHLFSQAQCISHLY